MSPNLAVIWEYSSSIAEDEKKNEEKIKQYKEKLEELLR